MTVQIFLVSDRNVRPERPIVDLLAEAAAAGVDRIQLREKDLPDRELYELARATIEACRPHGCRIYINGRPDIALATGADGLHLPANGMPVEQARALVGGKLEIGVSTHSIEEARAAQIAGADYVFLGPIFSTPSKREHGPPLGVELLKTAAEELKVPIFAIGGVDRDTASDLTGAPIAGIAVVRGILAEPDIPAAIGVLRDRLSSVKFDVGESLVGTEQEDDPDDEDEDDEDDPGSEGWGVG